MQAAFLHQKEAMAETVIQQHLTEAVVAEAALDKLDKREAHPIAETVEMEQQIVLQHLL
tara:strand:+ start:457 stop:633 length:177 start_codon:yes stop_codon:yes gene_type:complete